MATPLFKNPEDRAIIATADDAILAKLATVQAGYYSDPFVEPFGRHAVGIADSSRAARGRATTTSSSHRSRRQRQPRQVQPIIKRGTHARVCCMDRVIAAFVDYHHSSSSSSKNSDKDTTATPTQKTTSVQVVVLGCGKDTSYFRHGRQRPHVQWYEVDHPSVLQTKASILQESPDLFSSQIKKTEYGFSISTTTTTTHKADNNNTDATTSTCHLVEHDLRDSPQMLMDRLLKTTTTTTGGTGGFDVNAPTLFLFECVLMYMPEDATRDLLQCLAHNNHNAYVCCYEPILGLDSSFGKVMEQNLVQAGLVGDSHSCLLMTRTLEAQLDKLVNCGFSAAVGCDMSLAYETVVTQAQRTRANHCEFLDEIEEWLMIMRHYCFVVASTAAGSDFGKHVCSVGPTSALGFAEGKCTTRTE